MKINFENKPKGIDLAASKKWSAMAEISEGYARMFPSEKEYYLEQADESRQFAKFYAEGK